MATNDDLKKIAQKALEDDGFRAELEKDPVKAAASIGITLSSEQAESIKLNAANAEEAGSRESKGLFSIVSNITVG